MTEHGTTFSRSLSSRSVTESIDGDSRWMLRIYDNVSAVVFVLQERLAGWWCARRAYSAAFRDGVLDTATPYYDNTEVETEPVANLPLDEAILFQDMLDRLQAHLW